MFAGLTGWHLIIILALILLLFGAAKLPALAKSVGQSVRIFKGEVDEMKKDGKENGTPASPAPSADSTAAPAAADPSTESKPKP